MTDLAEQSQSGIGSRIGRMAFRLMLGIILASPVAVGFWLAPKAENMPAPPELTAPPSVTKLPESVLRMLPTLSEEQRSQAKATPVSSGG